MFAPLLALAAVALGLALVLADQHVARSVLRRTADPESGAATARVLGLILFVAGGVAFLAWAP
jgi:uncharacterized membrane protein